MSSPFSRMANAVLLSHGHKMGIVSLYTMTTEKKKISYSFLLMDELCELKYLTILKHGVWMY